MRIMMQSVRSFRSTAAVLFFAVLAVTLTGCTALPGQEPFGEQTYPAEQAQAAYERIASSSLWEEMPRGYTMAYESGAFRAVEFYHTEEYTVAYSEQPSGAYLWYQGHLYLQEGDTLVCREMPWEALGSDAVAAELWELARRLVERDDAELDYQYIPMAGDHPHLLRAEYPLAETEQGWEIAPALAVSWGTDGAFGSVTISWQEVNDRDDLTDNVLVGVTFYPYEGSTNLQAERKIWFVGSDCGLTAEVVPALSKQEEDREWCREIVAGMGFDTLPERIVHRDNLEFPFVWKYRSAGGAGL